MEIWIRSQDKKTLQKVNKLYATTYSEEAGYGIYDLSYDDLEDIDDCDVPLGFYKTKERALEVLDEIQDILKPRTITKFKNELKYNEDKELKTTYTPFETVENTEFQELSTYVYEMPKE